MNFFRGLLHLSVIGGLFIYSSHLGAATFDEGMARVLDKYLKIQDDLASDSFSKIPEAAQQLQSQALELKKAASANQKEVALKLGSAAGLLNDAKDIKKAREVFKQLSSAMISWVSTSKPKGIRIASCSMAKAKWVQKDGPIRNPYYGKEMLECGEFE
jgi:hypothetical protein